VGKNPENPSSLKKPSKSQGLHEKNQISQGREKNQDLGRKPKEWQR